MHKLTKSVIIRNMNTVPKSELHAERVKASDLANYLLSHGIAATTTGEIADLLKISVNQVPQRMQALKRKGAIVAPAKGLWIPVPPEYMTWGAPPAIDMIDSLMKHLSLDYYIGWLSAAAYHGASHHAPQVFQVAVSRSMRNRVIGRSDFRFFHRSNIAKIRTASIESRNGKVSLSSRETTLLDITSNISIAGGLDNVANLVIELCGVKKPSIPLIVELSQYYPTAALKRLGWLMENFTEIEDVYLLRNEVFSREVATSVLDPQSGRSGVLDLGWSLILNKVVDPDV